MNSLTNFSLSINCNNKKDNTMLSSSSVASSLYNNTEKEYESSICDSPCSEISARKRKTFDCDGNAGNIVGIRFELMTSKILRRESVFTVKKQEDLCSLRFGAVVNGQICETCGKKDGVCITHSGIIECPNNLQYIHPLMLDTLVHILNSVCFECHKLNVNSDTLSKISDESIGIQRIREIRNLCKRSKCIHCKEPIRAVTRMKCKSGVMRDRNELSVMNIKHVLDNSMNECILHFRMNPCDLIMDCIGVPPNSIRISDHQQRKSLIPKLPSTKTTSVFNTKQNIYTTTTTTPTSRKSKRSYTDGLTKILENILRVKEEYLRMVSNKKENESICFVEKKFQFVINDYFLGNSSQKAGDFASNGSTKNHGKYSTNSTGTQDTVHKSLFGDQGKKEGDIRSGVHSKRVAHTGRAVIIGSKLIPVGSIGIPNMVAKAGIEEIITPLNRKYWIKRVKVKPDTIIGIRDNTYNTVTYFNGQRKSFPLIIGHSIIRIIEDGDVVLFGRQPTLSKESMTAMKVILISGDAICMNPSITKRYNADHDGDEMYIIAPMGSAARVEAYEIMSVESSCRSAKNGESNIVWIQDGVLGLALITHPACIIKDRSRVMQLVGSAEGFSKKNKFYTLHPNVDLCSNRLQSNTNMDLDDDDDDNRRCFNVNDMNEGTLFPMYVERCQNSGECIDTRWTGRSIMSLAFNKHLSLGVPLHTQWKVLVNEKTKNIQSVKGLASNLLDCLMNQEDGTCESCTIYKGNHQFGIMTKKPGYTAIETVSKYTTTHHDESENEFEDFINGVQSVSVEYIEKLGVSMSLRDLMPAIDLKVHSDKAKDDINKILQSNKNNIIACEDSLSRVVMDLVSATAKLLPPDNKMNLMSRCGSKGSSANSKSLLTSVGQQTYLGRGMPKHASNSRVTTYNFKNDYAGSIGYVPNSFGLGLKLIHMLFTGMGDRSGVVNRAVSTQETGTAHRTYSRRFESIIVKEENGYGVRDENDQLIQERFGGDGTDPTFLSSTNVDCCFEPYSTYNSPEKFINRYTFSDCSSEWQRDEKERLFDALEFIKCSYYKKTYKAPISLEQLLPECASIPRDIYTPAYIPNGFEEEEYSRYSYKIKMLCRYIAKSNLLFAAILTIKCTIRRLIIDCSCSNIDELLFDMLNTWILSRIPIGESVGLRTTHEIVALMMQGMLDSVHRKSANKLQSICQRGQPRFKELNSSLEPPLIIATRIPIKRSALETHFDIKLKDLCVSGTTLETIYEETLQDEITINNNTFIKTLLDLEKTHNRERYDRLMNADRIIKLQVDVQQLERYGMNLVQLLEFLQKNVYFNVISAGIASETTWKIFFVYTHSQFTNNFTKEQMKYILAVGDLKMKNVNFASNNTVIRDAYIDMSLDGLTRETEINKNNKDVYTMMIINGKKLHEIRCISDDSVYVNKIVSNDPREVCCELGVEASRLIHIKECLDVASDSGGNTIDIRYFSLLSDILIKRGILDTTSVSAAARDKNSVLSLMAFADPKKAIIDGMLSNATDNLSSLSSSTSVGNPIKCGTQFVKLKVGMECIDDDDYEEKEYENNNLSTRQLISQRLLKRNKSLTRQFKTISLSNISPSPSPSPPPISLVPPRNNKSTSLGVYASSDEQKKNMMSRYLFLRNALSTSRALNDGGSDPLSSKHNYIEKSRKKTKL